MLKAIRSFIMLYEHLQGFEEREISKASFKLMLMLSRIRALRRHCASLIGSYRRGKSEFHAKPSAEPQESTSRDPFNRLKIKEDILKTANRTARNHPQFLTYKALALACGLSEREIAQHFNRDEQDVIAWCQGWASIPFEAKQELINLLNRKRAEVAAACITETTDVLVLTIPDQDPERECPLPHSLYLSTAGEIAALKKAEEVQIIPASEIPNVLSVGFFHGRYKVQKLYQG